MPVYDFMAPEDSVTHQHAEEIAAAVTNVHVEVTHAPAAYVFCSFATMPAGTMFISGQQSSTTRMVGLIREGRSAALRGRLMRGIAEAWSEITGRPQEERAIFLREIPGANCFEYGQILREAGDDPGAITD